MADVKYENCIICKKVKVVMDKPFKPMVCTACKALPPDRLFSNNVESRRKEALKGHHHEKFKKAQKNKRESPVAELIESAT
jgi:hypothetical protein